MADPESCEEKRGPEGGDGASFGDQKAVGGNTEGGMVVEAAPPAPLIITKAEFLLQLLIIALDPPSPLCEIDQTFEGDILGQSGKPILGRLGFSLRPLDQKPLCRARLGQLGIAMRRPHARQHKGTVAHDFGSPLQSGIASATISVLTAIQACWS